MGVDLLFNAQRGVPLEIQWKYEIGIFEKYVIEKKVSLKILRIRIINIILNMCSYVHYAFIILFNKIYFPAYSMFGFSASLAMRL